MTEYVSCHPRISGPPAKRVCSTRGPPDLDIPKRVEPTVEVNYYDIRGRSVKALKKSMVRRGPRSDGKRFHAYTTWRVRWALRLQNRGGKCVVEDVDLSLTVVYDFPHWSTPRKKKRRPDGLQDRWEEYATALWQHEKGHADYGIKAAKQVRKALMNAPPQSTCDALREEIQERAGKRMAIVLEQEKNYDAETQHGLTQGVVLD